MNYFEWWSSVIILLYKLLYRLLYSLLNNPFVISMFDLSLHCWSSIIWYSFEDWNLHSACRCCLDGLCNHDIVDCCFGRHRCHRFDWGLGLFSCSLWRSSTFAWCWNDGCFGLDSSQDRGCRGGCCLPSFVCQLQRVDETVAVQVHNRLLHLIAWALAQLMKYY